MIYVMSDLHGQYEKYCQMLELIHFSDEDVLYVLGDVVDKGCGSFKILFDMMERFNVYVVMGNHDYVAYHILSFLSTKVEDESLELFINEMGMKFYDWYFEGGNLTFDEFCQLDEQSRNDVLEYMEEFAAYESVSVKGKEYLLVHAGLGDLNQIKDMSEYTLDELLFIRYDWNDLSYADKSKTIIVGHTPTLMIHGKPEILRSHNVINVDCGSYLEKGRLACLCLDTMQEFYI